MESDNESEHIGGLGVSKYEERGVANKLMDESELDLMDGSRNYLVCYPRTATAILP